MMQSVFWLVLLSVAICPIIAFLWGPTQPPKPDFSSVYVTSEYTKTTSGDCLKGEEVWVFEPLTKKAGGADVVVFIKAIAALPIIYIEHIEHLVFQGNYVIFPQYQEGLCLNGKVLIGWVDLLIGNSMTVWAERTAQRAQETLDELDPSSYNNLYLWSHSLGGSIGMTWGSLGVSTPLRTPVTAGVISAPTTLEFPTGGLVNEEILEKVPLFDLDVTERAAETTFPVAVLHGSSDVVIAPMKTIWPAFNALGTSEKAVYQAQTDKHGSPPLVADHFMATNTDTASFTQILFYADTFDYRFHWAALDQVMAGTPVMELQFDMGEWSDGQKVKSVEMLVEGD